MSRRLADSPLVTFTKHDQPTFAGQCGHCRSASSIERPSLQLAPSLIWIHLVGTRLMTNRSTSTTAPISQWSINARPAASLSSPCNDHDSDFLDKLFYLKPGEHCPSFLSKISTYLRIRLLLENNKPFVAIDRPGNDGTVNLSVEDDRPAGPNDKKRSLSDTTRQTFHSSNALCLHLEPSTPLPTDRYRPVSTQSDNVVQQKDSLRPNARVRFRSRVRITSGIGRHRGRSGSDDIGRSSSRSASPSSSISAPLRSPADNATNAWGTLGQRVGLLGLQRKLVRNAQAQRRQKIKQGLGPASLPNERTPLISPQALQQGEYIEGDVMSENDLLDEDSDDERLAQEVDHIFGTFPSRLLNRHVRRTSNLLVLTNANYGVVKVLVVATWASRVLPLCCRSWLTTFSCKLILGTSLFL